MFFSLALCFSCEDPSLMSPGGQRWEWGHRSGQGRREAIGTSSCMFFGKSGGHHVVWKSKPPFVWRNTP